MPEAYYTHCGHWANKNLKDSVAISLEINLKEHAHTILQLLKYIIFKLILKFRGQAGQAHNFHGLDRSG